MQVVLTIKFIKMKRVFGIIALFLLMLSAKAQDIRNFYVFDKINNTIEFDISKITLFEQRTHLLYLLSNDERFVVTDSEKDGIFVLKQGKNGYNFNLEDTFNSFCDDEKASFNNMTKDEVGELYSEWKSSLPDSFIASMMMDIYVKDRQNNLCATADPFCTDVGLYEFPAGVNAGSGEFGPDYACLSSQPNPAWYYMKMANAGSMTIHMFSTPQRDIDFCCWGPFEDPITPCPNGLTLAKKVSCSYSADPTENCLIPNSAQSGEYYILVITNYSNDNCNITFSKTAGSGTTDCSIMPPLVQNDGPYCIGETITLSGNAQSGATYSWSGPGGWTANGQNVTIPHATLAMTGTYTCTIALNGQTSSAETEVVVYAQPIADFNVNAVCIGGATVFTSTSTTNPPGQPITRYHWEFGDGESSAQQNPTHTYAQAGTYTATLTVHCGEITCTDEKTKTVTVYDLPTANAGDDISVNFNNTATLSAATVQGASYLWRPAEKINGNPGLQTVQTLPLTETTTFTCTVTKNGCSDSDQMTVYVGAEMTATASIEDSEICEGSSTTVSASAHGGNGSYQYTWQSSRPATFSNPNSASTTVYPQETGEYTLTCAVYDGQTSMRPQVNLTVNAAENIDIHEAVCPSELPYILELPDGTTQSFTEATPADGWHTTVQNQFGCNVNVSLYLTINDIVENEYFEETCDEPFTFIDNGHVIKVLDHTCDFDTVYPYGDCEKHVMIHFTRHEAYNENYQGEYVSDNYPAHHCNSYTWPSNGQTYDSWGDYPWTFQTIHGCDSVVTLHLDQNNLSFVVDYGASSAMSIDTCKNASGYYLWGSEPIYVSNSSSPYQQTFPNASTEGCDSIGYLNIRLYDRPQVQTMTGVQLVEPGVVFMPYIYEYHILDISGAGTESDYPLGPDDFTWEIFSYYNTPNHVHNEPEDFESTWQIGYIDDNDRSAVYVYVNSEGNALLKCTIHTICGDISIDKFLYTQNYQYGESVDEPDYETMVNVFPNPTSGELYIGYSQMLTTEPLIISIYNCNGALIDQFYGNTDNNVTHYSMSKMPNGLYFIRFTGDDFVVTKRFVLNR